MSETEHDPWYADETCVECDEPIDHTGYPEDSDYIGEYGSHAMYQSIDDENIGHLCLYCRESWDEHANTLVVTDHRGRIGRIKFDDGILLDEAHYGRDLEPLSELGDEIEDAVLSIVANTGWVSTDAWRGYTSVPDDADGFVKAKGGWHSSVTQTGASNRVNELLDGELHDLGIIDIPVIGVFSTTSNVMSTGVDLYVPDGHDDAIAQLFERVSSGLDGSL